MIGRLDLLAQSYQSTGSGRFWKPFGFLFLLYIEEAEALEVYEKTEKNKPMILLCSIRVHSLSHLKLVESKMIRTSFERTEDLVVPSPPANTSPLAEPKSLPAESHKESASSKAPSRKTKRRGKPGEVRSLGEYASINDIAMMIGVTTAAIYIRRKAGSVPPVLKDKTRRKYLVTPEILEWIEKTKRK